MEGGGAGGVVSGTPGEDRDDPEVPPGVVGVVGVALRPLKWIYDWLKENSLFKVNLF